ncbi:hypothetical protein ES703_117022 [subsurface metagenome]
MLRTPQTIVKAGIVPTYHECSEAGDEFVNSGKTVIHIKNSEAETARIVTIDTYTKCNYGLDTEHDVAVTVEGIDPGPTEKVIGPFPKSRFNDPNGRVQITYDHHENLHIAIVDLP